MLSDLLEDLTALIDESTPQEALCIHQALATLSTLCLVRAIEGKEPTPRRSAEVLHLAAPPTDRPRPRRARRLRSGS